MHSSGRGSSVKAFMGFVGQHRFDRVIKPHKPLSCKMHMHSTVKHFIYFSMAGRTSRKLSVSANGIPIREVATTRYLSRILDRLWTKMGLSRQETMRQAW